MARFQSQEELIKHMRSTYPGTYRNMSDEDIYSNVSDMLKNAGQILPEYKPKPIYSPTQELLDTQEDEDATSPSFINKLYEIGKNIVLGGAAEAFTETGFLGLPPEFFQKSYMESNAGNLNTALSGKEKYNVEDYEYETLAEEAGGFLLGMLSPVEVGLIVSGGKFGQMAAKAGVTGTSLLKKYGMKALGYNATKGVGQTSANFISSSLSAGVGLGTFGAAHSAFAEAAKQRTTGTGEINYKKVVDTASEGYLNSFVLGAPMGLIGRGFLGNYYAKHKLAEKPLTSISRIATGAPGQLSTEIAAFSVLPNAYKELGMEAYQDSPDMPKDWLDFNDPWWRNAGFNAAIVTPMFAMNKTFEARKKFKEKAKLVDEVMKIEEEYSLKEIQAQENIQTNMGVAVTNDMIREISATKEFSRNIKQERAEFNKNVKKLYEIIDRTNADYTKTTEQDKIFLQKEGAKTLLDLEGGALALSENNNLLRSALDRVAAKNNITLKESDYIAAEKANKLEIDLIQNMFKEMNNSATGSPEKKVVIDESAPPETVREVTLVKEFKQPDGSFKTGKETVVEGTGQYEKLISEGYKVLDTTEVGSKVVLQPDAKQYRDAIDFVSAKNKVKYEGLSKLNDASKDALANALLQRNKQIPETMSILNQLMEFSGKTNLQSLKPSDTTNFLKSKLQKQKREGKSSYINPQVSTNLNQISALLTDLGFIKSTFSSPTILKGINIVSGQTKGLKGAGQVPGATAETIASAVDNIKLRRSSVKFNRVEQAALELADYYQIRDRELNALRVKDFNKDANTLDLTTGTGVGKKDSGSRFIYLDNKEVIKVLTNLSKNKKPNEKLFPKIADKITKAMQAELKKVDGVEYKKATAKSIRKMGQLTQDASNLNNIEQQIWQQTTAHDLGVAVSNRIKTIYENIGNAARNKKAAEWQKIVLDKVFRDGTKSITPEMIAATKPKRAQTTIVEGQEKPKFQRKAEDVPAEAVELRKIIREEVKKNPGVEARILKDVDYAGRFYSGVIDVVQGKANIRTWYHENAHRLKNMIDTTGNKELKAIWKQGEKIFKKDAKGRNMEEFMADTLADWAVGRRQNTGIAAKMKSWAGRMWTKIKQVFFGKSNLNKNDIKNSLGDKIYKGFATSKSPAATSLQMYQFANNADRAKFVKSNFDFAVKESGKDISPIDKKILVNYIATRANIPEPSKFKLGNSKMTESDLVAFDRELSITPFNKLLKLSDVGKRLESIQSVEAIERGSVNINDRANILKLFGVKDGNIYSATSRQLSEYNAYLMKIKYPGQDNATAYLNEMKIQTLDKIPKEFKNVTGLKRKAALLTMPTHQVVGMLGLKDLQSRLLQHASIETRLQGKFTEGFEVNAKKIMKGKWEGLLGKGVRDNLFLSDYERYLDLLNTNQLNASNKMFISKVFKSDFVIKKDNKFIKNPKYKTAKEGLQENTKESQVVKEWIEYTELMEAELKSAARASFKNEAEYAEFLKNGEIGWITKNVYVPRIPTRQFLEAFPQHGGRYHNDLVQSTANKIAKEMAVKEHGPGATVEQIANKMGDAMKVAESAVQDIYTFSEKKSSTRFIKSRNAQKLPEYINIDGKKIKVYETKYENVIKPYGLGMSKFIANIEMFPELTKLKSINVAGNRGSGDMKTLLGALKGNREWGSWIREQVEQQLGMVESSKGLKNDVASAMDYGATVFAKTALGFPTSGGKNLILGQSMNMQSYYLRDYIRGLVKASGSDFQKMVRMSGATELGLRDIKTVNTQKIWDGIFKLGLMKPTENANRYIAVATSKYEQARLIRTLSNPKESAKRIKKAENRLKDFYFLNDKQVGLLKKYGQNGLSGYEKSFGNSFEKAKIKRELMNIEQQLNTYAHINTQGAAMNLFQPGWAGGRIAKPLLLFKRMAYAASNNQVRNAQLAIKNKDFMKLSMMALTPVASGATIVGMYHYLLGTPMPNENSTWAEWVKQMFIRGEVFGLGSDVLRILEGESAEFTIYPSLVNWGLAWVDLVKAPMEGGMFGEKTKTWEQSGKDFLSKTSSGYRGYINTMKRRGEKNKMYRTSMKGKMLWEDFNKEVFPDERGPSVNFGQVSPFYRDFREVFYGGTTEEAAKQYIISIYALAGDIYRQKITSEGKVIKSYDEALKDAVSRFEGELTKLNPNPISFMDKITGEKEEKSMAWLEWLNKNPEKGKKYIKELYEAESMYKAKKIAMQDLIPKYMQDKEVIKIMKKSLRRAGFSVK